MRKLLIPLSWIYGIALFLRNLAFDRGLLRVSRVRVPVLSVGNLTAGGTGKTPLVEWLVRHLIERGERVAVVSRGYGRRSTGVVVVSEGSGPRADAAAGGDEPVQIALKYPAARVVVGERRAEAAAVAVDRLGATVVVLDDGFQHRYLHRDLNILVLDGGEDIRQNPLLPAGMRREPLRGLGRADVVAVSGAVGPEDVRRRQEEVARFCSSEFIGYRTRLRRLTRAAGGESVPVEEFSGRRAYAFSAIGRHERFLASLADRGIVIAGEAGYRDHHWYTTEDIELILRRFRESHSEILITTGKDAVRIAADAAQAANFLPSFPVWVAEIEVQVTEGEELLLGKVERVLSYKH